MSKFLQLVGKIAGYKQNPRSHNGKDWVEHMVGVLVVPPDAYEGQTTVIDVKLDKKHVDSGLAALYVQARGTEVAVPVYIRAFPTKGGAGFEFHLAGDGKPLAITAERVKASA